LQLPRQLPVTLTLTIISALGLPKPNNADEGEIVDPYVKVWLEAPPPATLMAPWTAAAAAAASGAGRSGADADGTDRRRRGGGASAFHAGASSPVASVAAALASMQASAAARGGSISNAFVTSTVDNNGFHPVWRGGGSDSVVLRVAVPEMTTLALQVLDADIEFDEPLAEAFLPVHLMRSGVRCVPLWSPYTGAALPRAILMVSVVFDRDQP
jgi:hypothetical protein